MVDQQGDEDYSENDADADGAGQDAILDGVGGALFGGAHPARRGGELPVEESFLVIEAAVGEGEGAVVDAFDDAGDDAAALQVALDVAAAVFAELADGIPHGEFLRGHGRLPGRLGGILR